jgi:hypothetical protein
MPRIFTFDKQNERPTIVALGLDCRKAGCKQSTKCPAQRRGTIEETNSVQYLMPLIKHCDINDYSAE